MCTSPSVCGRSFKKHKKEMFSKWSHQNIFAHFLVLTRPKRLLFSNKRKRVNIGQNAFTLNQGDTPLRPWVAGNEVIVKNVNANIPVSLSWFLLPFLVSLGLSSSTEPIDSSLQWPNQFLSELRKGGKAKQRKAKETTIKTQLYVCV